MVTELIALKYTVNNQNLSLQNIKQKVDNILKCLHSRNLSSIVTKLFNNGLLWRLDNEEQLEELKQLDT